MRKLARTMMALFMSVSIFTFSASVYASAPAVAPSSTQIETVSVSDKFINFIDNAFSNPEAISIADSNGADVTNKYIKEFTTYYSLKDYQSIQQVIKTDRLLVSYQTRKVVDTNSQTNPMQAAATNSGTIITPDAFSTEYFSKIIYHLETSKDGKFTKEWWSTLSGNAVVDPATGRIISASSPSLSIDENFGAAFSVSISNISTGSTIY